MPLSGRNSIENVYFKAGVLRFITLHFKAFLA